MGGRHSGTRVAAPPLHERIRRDLEAHILSGRWAPGHRLPTEQALVLRYGCARMTVHRALSELARRGLVERRKRAGTLVARPRVPSAVLAIPDLPAEVAARGFRYGYRLIAARARRASSADASGLGVRRGTPLLALRCLHLADDRPFAVEERLLNLAAVPAARTARFDRIAPGTWLLSHAPWTQAENHIAAIGADTALATALDLAPGTACLQISRRTWRSGEAITSVKQTFPGDRYHLLARFTPETD